MKKILVTLLTIAMSVTMLAGCGKKYDDSSTNLSDIDIDKYVLKLGEYKGLEISGTKEVITDEYVNSYIDYMLTNSKVPVEVTGRAIQNGDVANVDFTGKIDGKAFDGGSAQAYDLTIGSGSFIAGFEEGLIGLNIGDTKDLNLTFPTDYTNKDLAGKAVVFSVKVNKISEPTLPQLNDEYVKSLGIDNCENVDQFKVVVRQSLESNAETTYNNDLQQKAVEALMSKCEFAENSPQGVLDYYKKMINENLENEAIQVGMTLDDYISKYYGMTKEEYNTKVEDGATNSTKQSMVCMKIASLEKFKITDKELDEEIDKNYANFGFDSAEAYKKSGNPEDYRNSLLINKVLQFLVDNAKVTEETKEENSVESSTENATLGFEPNLETTEETTTAE